MVMSSSAAVIQSVRSPQHPPHCKWISRRHRRIGQRLPTFRSDGSFPACPVIISQQDPQKMAALNDSLRDVDTELKQINMFLGVGSDGWTSNELFEQVKERSRSIKADGLAAQSMMTRG
ncbi:uncharacterized protein BDCG_16544 [Blastomyces dermatitidis ER-3]|uniref:Uncharacterized protein n=1 Tax=Ajellomyces dermatitidis (strain ER-3 / ATCC MYA-2586) TaxID=559297 RepID=A0ABX2VSR1_AJEDR|nr:uncharacterized protein BDCG_16544 [Blastomyces dermatitidis ER-3]OAT00245.1 hypothetical protein BDCG_16544 [Blastomyces dermatitidis ER-3]